MRRLSYTAAASADLNGIHRRLLIVASSRIAIEQLNLIRNTAKRLREFPNIGPALDEEAVRTLRVRGTPFTLVYAVLPDAINILRVRHHAQDWHAWDLRPE
jgi:plasmid stabilization system protein ParE